MRVLVEDDGRVVRRVSGRDVRVLARGPEEVQRHPPGVPVGRRVHRRVVEQTRPAVVREVGAYEGLGPDRVSTLAAEPVVVHRLEVAGRLREPDGRRLEVVVIGVEQVVGLDRFLAAVESPAVRVVGVPGARGRGPAVLRWRRGVEDGRLSPVEGEGVERGDLVARMDRVVTRRGREDVRVVAGEGFRTGDRERHGSLHAAAARQERGRGVRPGEPGARLIGLHEVLAPQHPSGHGIDHGAVDARGRDGRDRGPSEPGGALRREAHQVGAVARPGDRRGATSPDTRRGLGGLDRLGGRERRAGQGRVTNHVVDGADHRDQGSVGLHRGLQPRPEDRLVTHDLHPREVMGPEDVHVVVAEREQIDIGRGDPEGVEVVAEEPESHVLRGQCARSGEGPVDVDHPTHRPQVRVGVHEHPVPDRGGEAGTRPERVRSLGGDRGPAPNGACGNVPR